MNELTWRDAIVRVLELRGEPTHYAEIAEAIAEQGLRTNLGATPASTVNAVIASSLQSDGDNSLFLRAGRGIYSLRTFSGAPQTQLVDAGTQEPDETGLINAFGMYWARDQVVWAARPRILGAQQPTSAPVDFCDQKGVYLLYDGRSVVYVGRTTVQPLGTRLLQHISDRLNGRWDRFSWFGVYPVNASGDLNSTAVVGYDLNVLIATMEALLIEGLEPPQNRKRGDDFRAIEFLQVTDPEIQKNQIIQLIDELKKKL